MYNDLEFHQRSYIGDLITLKQQGGGGYRLLRRSLRCNITTVTVLTTIPLRLVLFLPLHSTVLKPNLDLPLCQTQCVCDFDPPSPR